MTAPRDLGARLWPWIAAGAIWVLADQRHDPVFGPIDDEALLYPIAMRHTGVAAFDGDRWLAATSSIFSVPYSWLVGAMLHGDGPVAVSCALSLAAHLLFLIGTWRLVERLAGRTAALVAVALCAVPHLADLVLAPGAALPRDLVFALVPWLVLGAEAVRERSLPVRLAPYAALGLVANLHPLTALHVAMWLGAIEVVRTRSRTGLRDASLGALVFAAGALPYVIQYVTRPAVAGPVDETVYSWRLAAMAGEDLDGFTRRMEPLLWLAGASMVLSIAASRAGRPLPRWLTWGTAIALVVAALGPTLGRFVPPLRGFQFDRFERIGARSLIVSVAVGAALARRAIPIALAALLVAVAAFAPAALGGAPPRGPVARLVRKMTRDGAAPAERAAPSGLVTRPGVVDPTSQAERAAFFAVCRFARESTPANSLFLVPPENWAPFRVYGCRGVFVTRKEGGAALSFLGAAGMDWFRDYSDAVRVYAGGSPADWTSLVERAGATHAVIDAATPSPPPWPVAFESPPFRVLAVPTK